MRKLMVVLAAVAFLSGASLVYAVGDEAEENDDHEEYALVGDIQDIKDILSQILAELQKLNRVLTGNYMPDVPLRLPEGRHKKTFDKPIFREVPQP